MRADNKIIQGLWIGPRLSVLEQLSIRSFLENGHEYHLYVYDEPEGVPPGTTLKFADEILGKDRVFFNQLGGFGGGGLSNFSELFRYKLLHDRGGWWADLDVICLRTFDHVHSEVICTSREGHYGNLACTFVMKLPVGGRLSNYLVTESSRKRPEDIGYLEIGPFLVQRMVRELSLKQELAPPDDFAPIGWRGLDRIARKPARWSLRRCYRAAYWQWRFLIHPESYPGRVRPTCYAVHFWNEFWKANGMAKDAQYSPACLFEKLKYRYLRESALEPR